MIPVTLPQVVARCPETRTGDCWQSSGCARAQVAHELGRPVQDYTTETGWAPERCVYMISASEFRIAPAAPGPKVHEAQRGMSC